MSSPVDAPVALRERLRHLGPGLIITAIIVGSGELIVTPKLGATYGFSLLWFIIAGCLVKVFLQIELGRFTMARGITTLEALNLLPGPRLRVSWILWLWLLMFVCLLFQLAGMIGGLATIFQLAGVTLDPRLIAVGVAGSCSLLLAIGRYRLVEFVSMALVALFTVCTLVAVACLQTTPYAIKGADLARGFAFQLPPSFTIAFATFGIIGVGASELIFYPYWCLEKGYARRVGPNDGSPAWQQRARGWIRVMSLDAWVSFALYTSTTVAFYLLGAAILHRKGLVVADSQMIDTLSHMYRETFGEWSLAFFYAGAFAVLYSTVFGATASNARLFTDALGVFGVWHFRDDAQRTLVTRITCAVLPAIFVIIFTCWGAPVSLVLVGALAQALMLPFLAFAGLYFHFYRIEPALRPRQAWRVGLLVSALLIATAGLYQMFSELRKLLP